MKKIFYTLAGFMLFSIASAQVNTTPGSRVTPQSGKPERQMATREQAGAVPAPVNTNITTPSTIVAPAPATTGSAPTTSTNTSGAPLVSQPTTTTTTSTPAATTNSAPATTGTTNRP